MIKSFYTYFRILLALLPVSFLFFKADKISLPFFVTVILFTLSIQARRLLKKDSLTYFETKLNYFLDEFFVYGAVILLSAHSFAPLFVVVIYFYKDATIDAIRNFAITQNEPLQEKLGYKLDKVVQYSVILLAAYCFVIFPSLNIRPESPPAPFIGTLSRIFSHFYLQIMFYISAGVSALTLLSFYISNREFMKKIHNS